MGADWRVRNPWQPQAQDGVSALEAPPGFRAAPRAGYAVTANKITVPPEPGGPRTANQSGPLRRIVGTEA